MIVLIGAMALLLLSAATAPAIRRSPLLDSLSLAFGLGGAVCGLVAAVFCLLHPDTAVIDLPWPGLEGRLLLRLDPLAAVFLLPAFLVGGAGFLYGIAYWPATARPDGCAWIRFFYPLALLGVCLLLTGGNGLLFLIGWEVMALAGYFLVVTERHSDESHPAGLIYLTATHTGTLALLAVFALLGSEACLQSLPAAASLPAASTTATAVFLFALCGFGLKAGIVPLHIWLPRAHAAAPSHVSALMSGVMIKTGIYGILRITGLFSGIPSWWGWLILTLGAVSGLLGVLFAICQHDIKRLLAYHSIENIGIILLGIGIALLGQSHGQAAVTVLGLGGALLHVINHGLFKALLFFAAGAMIQATGTRQMAAHGGLLRTMPRTALFFLGGAVAICGLPPLNGFVSEWLVYLGLLRAGLDPDGGLAAGLLAVVALAMIGGLALLCFAKVFGLCFLGAPRPAGGEGGKEAGGTMQGAMALLLAACLWIGLLPVSMLPLLDGAVAAWQGGGEVVGGLAVLAPTGGVSLAALLLVGLLFLLYRTMSRRTGASARRAPTWGCGYVPPLPRARYTPASFTEMIMALFRWLLRSSIEEERPAGLHPVAGRMRIRTPDPVLDLALLPLAAVLARWAGWTRRLVQHGNIGIYLLYTAVALCLLLAVAIRS
ncbi:MAG: proton-conducting transporter membrane subunit [Thermodesulfobacteriota bacterium]